MCSNPKVFLRLKNKYDLKFRVFAKKSRLFYVGYASQYEKQIVNGGIASITPSTFGYDNFMYDVIFLPCGQCLTCRFQRASIRAAQGYCELKTSVGAKFITLTFGDNATYEYLKEIGFSDYKAKKYTQFLTWSLEKEEFQKFMKRLRSNIYEKELRAFCKKYDFLHKYIYMHKNGVIIPRLTVSRKMSESDALFVKKNFKPTRFRYIHCGEYGERHARPHHHVILFYDSAVDFGVYTESHYKSGKIEQVNRSILLNDLWKFGESSCDDVSYSSINYVCRYVTKKVVGAPASQFYDGKKPEFSSCSNRPGIGHDYFFKFAESLINTGSIPCKSKKGKILNVPLPRYFRELYRRINPVSYLVQVEKNLSKSMCRFEKIFESGFIPYCNSQNIDSKNIFRTLKRGFESGHYDYDSFLKKCVVFDVPIEFAEMYPSYAKQILDQKSYKNFENFNTSQSVIDARKRFEQYRVKNINRSYDIAMRLYDRSDKSVDIYTLQEEIVTKFKKMQNPFEIKNKRIDPEILRFPQPSKIVCNGREFYC